MFVKNPKLSVKIKNREGPDIARVLYTLLEIVIPCLLLDCFNLGNGLTKNLH